MDSRVASSSVAMRESVLTTPPMSTDASAIRTRLCIASPNKNAYTETFIRDHVNRLPADVKLLYKGFYPMRQDGDRRIAPIWFSAVVMAHERAHVLPEKMIRDLRTRVLADYFERNRIEVVMAEYGLTGVEIYEACRRAAVPLIVHFHGFDAFHHDTLLQYGSRYPAMFESASAIVAVSRDMTRQLQELGAPPEKIYYNSCGVDLTQFQGADPANAPPRFLAVGRFVEKKGPLFTIEAFQKVVARCPDACLTMVGDGPLLDDCRRKCEDLGLNEAVRFLPPTPHDEISKLMKSARAFVQHSMISAGGDCEGTPVAVLEAAASGLPVVSTKHGGIKDAVMSGKTGFLVDEGDVDGMAAHMISLVEDPELAGRLGRAGREHMREAFDMEKQIGRLWEILHAALP